MKIKQKIRKDNKLKCGCVNCAEGAILFCKLHMTAPALLGAAKRLVKALAKGDPQYSMNEEEGLALNTLDSTIAIIEAQS